MNRIWTIALVGAVAAVSGCSQSERASVRQDVQGMRQQMGEAAHKARVAARNATAEAKIKNALESRKGLEAKGIDVEMRSGHVTLKGDVASREQAELAEKVTLETDGVTAVDNQLMLRVPATTKPYVNAP